MPELLIETSSTRDGSTLWCALHEDCGPNGVIRQRINNMWSRFRPFASPQFLAEFPLKTEDRLWEMALATALLDHGLTLLPQPNDAPDIGLLLPCGQRVWIEATRLTPGDPQNKDRVPELRTLSETGMMQLVPEDQIVLRFMEALDRKRRQWRSRVKRGRVSQTDVYVIALNGAGAQCPMLFNSHRFLFKALFGLGARTAVFDIASRKTVETFHEPRPMRARANGREMSSSLFLSPEAAELSAVICSDFQVASALVV